MEPICDSPAGPGEILRRKAGEFRRRAATGAAANPQLGQKLLRLAQLYELRAGLAEENERLREELARLGPAAR